MLIRTFICLFVHRQLLFFLSYYILCYYFRIFGPHVRFMVCFSGWAALRSLSSQSTTILIQHFTNSNNNIMHTHRHTRTHIVNNIWSIWFVTFMNRQSTVIFTVYCICSTVDAMPLSINTDRMFCSFAWRALSHVPSHMRQQLKWQNQRKKSQSTQLKK